jgi:hypothetical protein
VAALDLKNLNWPTLILILVTSGGNSFVTTQNSQQRGYEIQRALHEIHEIHQAMDGFEERQKENLERAIASLSNQASMLKNQTDILDAQNKTMESQSRILERLQRFANNFKNPEFHQ